MKFEFDRLHKVDHDGIWFKILVLHADSGLIVKKGGFYINVAESQINWNYYLDNSHGDCSGGDDLHKEEEEERGCSAPPPELFSLSS